MNTSVNFNTVEKTDELKYWLGFSRIYSIGTIHFNRLLQKFGSVEAAWHASPSAMVEIEGFSSIAAAKFIEERNSIGDLERLEEEVLREDIKIITIHDKNYPYLLKEIYDPPIVLFLKGSLERFNQEKGLAVVGSRKASHYIKEVLKKIISDIPDKEVSIISGMALGVDSTAHQAALDNGFNTLAVIGSGFDNIYPAKNKPMVKEIVRSGGVIVSEYLPNQQAAVWTFPRRNRIISGLAKGVLVGEAGLKSGALITARLALEQNRELMCIPGNITNSNTEGTFKLIKDGAAVITEAKDIFNTLGWEFKRTYNLQNAANSSSLGENSQNEKNLYHLLDFEPKTFDELLHETGMGIDELMISLTTLELEGVITQLPGQMFVKNL